METKKTMNFFEVNGNEFSITIPRDREYTSLEEKNGWGNQTFSSNDMPETIKCKCFGFTRYSSDGKIHPVCYGMEDLVEQYYLKSKNGFWHSVNELNFLCKFFCRQNGLYDVRSITKTDMSMINSSEFKDTTFWLGSNTVNTYIGTFSLAVYAAYGGKVCEDVLFYSYDYERCCCHPIRPVFVLDSEVQIPESWIKSSKINWV